VVLKLPAGAGAPIELPFNGLSQPFGVAVDTDGNVFVADSINDRVLKLPVQK
jgi:serine/threonine-protein kinase